MKIILSPAKTMNQDSITHKVESLPSFMSETKELSEAVRKLSNAEAKELWKVSDKLTQLNVDRFAEMNLEKNITPAVFTYEGLVYKQIGVSDFSEMELDYLKQHLRIISGFYGLVKPMDGITPYRLEMSNKLSVGEHKNLYQFWGDKIYQELMSSQETVLNLASKEYSRVVEKHLQAQDNFVDVEFVYEKDGKLRQLGINSKRARGEMVRFMAKNNVQELAELKEFKALDLEYSAQLSQDKKMVFLRK